MLYTVMTIINISSLILIAVVYFREHYTTVDLETWNKVVTFYNKNYIDEEDKPIATDNVGFFWDYVSNVEEDYEEEEPSEDE